MNPLIAALLSAALVQIVHADGDVPKPIGERVAKEFPALLDLYKHLHAHPEISFQEAKTAQRMAEELDKLGFAVSRNVGGHGVVGVLKNGAGPTVMVRTDLDALPVKEATGLPFASKITTVDESGKEVPTMHACGHDIHMTCWVGAARVLAALRNDWAGTLVFIAQPAEERGAGARRMIAEGLFKKFPVPNYALALHVMGDQPAGTLGYTSGFAMANVDSVDITVRGVGGHGSQPQSTKDPIVLSAQIILALQTIVSREVAPQEPAVITVGSIHGGTKHNIIPDEVHLQLTLRSYTDAVREQLIAAIRRVVRGQALAAGLPEDRLPLVVLRDEHTPAAYNDPKLMARLHGVFKTGFGEGALIERKPSMGGEDFGQYGRTEHKIPVCLFFLGAVSADTVRQARTTGRSLPSLHSALFAPDAEPTIRTGVAAMTLATLELLRRN